MKWNIWIIIAVVVLLMFFMQPKTTKKLAGTVTRDFAVDTVPTDTDLIITYSSTASATGIEDTVPSGWTLVTVSSTVSLNNSILRIFWTGPTTSVTLHSPLTEGQYTFSGIFQGTENQTDIITGESQITVQDCISQDSTSCVGNAIYYFDSCGTQEGIASACTWQCIGVHCQRNTIADTNDDGILGLAEMIVYAEQWVAQSGPTLSQVIMVAEVWVAQSSSPVDVPGGI